MTITFLKIKNLNMKYFLIQILTIFLFAGYTSAQKTNAYKIEADGYFTNLSVSNYGIVFTDNYASKLYLLKSNKTDTLVEARGCGRFYELSPDKNKIALKMFDSDGKQIPAILNLENKKITQLQEAVNLCGQPSFSSNGLISYTVNEELHITGSEETKTYNLGVYSNLTPISPNGNYVAYNNNNDQLFIINLETEEKTQFTDNKNAYVYPIWSPDSKKIAFSTMSGEILIYNIEKNETYFIGKGGNTQWSEDSEYILYQKTMVVEMEFKDSEIYLSNCDGTEKINLTNTENVSEMGAVWGKNNNIFYHTYNRKEIFSAQINLKAKNISKKKNMFCQSSKLDIGYYNSQKASKNKRDSTYIENVPYVNQVYDTPYYDGDYNPRACAPTTAIMVIAYYNLLPKWRYSMPYPEEHNNDYGGYVGDYYHYSEYYYNHVRRLAHGGYGYMWHSASPSSTMKPYFQNHNINSTQLWTSSCTYENVTNEIDNSYPYSICNYMTSGGHLVLARGYFHEQHTLICNDPYGNRNTPGWPSVDGADAYYDWPGYNNGYENLDADGTHGGVAWTVKTHTEQPEYNDTIIDDISHNHGFYMHNESPSHMKWFRDQNNGHNNHAWWTYSMEVTSDIAWVSWTPNIPENANYNVYAYIPSSFADAENAHYHIFYANGESIVHINQNEYSGEWVELGNFQFDAGQEGYVYLGDSTGVTNQHIAYDAMMWSRNIYVDRNTVDASKTKIDIYPNPISENATISYFLNRSEQVNISVTDMFGRNIILLTNEYKIKGEHRFSFNAKNYNIGKGTYILNFVSETKTGSHKFVIN